MKRVIMSILVSLAPVLLFASNSLPNDYVPTVVEGRTWWYNMDYWGSVHYECGISIGAEEVIDGVVWNRLEVNLSAKHKDDEARDFSTEPKLISYIREESGVIYTLLCYSELKNNPITANWAPETFLKLWSEDGHEVVSICKFGDTGDVAVFGNEKDFAKYTIDEIDTVESAGCTYRRYRTSWLPTETSNEFTPEREYVYLEGIGEANNELFFIPLGFYSANGYSLPKLAYVTDPDEKIIFEGAGGDKLWEIYKQSGIESPAVDASNQPREWYNLQGAQIEKPSYPGVYLQKTEHSVNKFIIR